MRTFAGVLLSLMMLGAVVGGSVAPAAASDVTVFHRELRPRGFQILCTGGDFPRFVVLSGDGTLVERVNADGSLDVVTQEHVTGIGTNGTEYVFDRTSRQSGVAPGEVTVVQYGVLVSKGSAPNESIKTTFSTTDGFDVEVVCHG